MIPTGITMVNHNAALLLCFQQLPLDHSFVNFYGSSGCLGELGLPAGFTTTTHTYHLWLTSVMFLSMDLLTGNNCSISLDTENSIEDRYYNLSTS